MKKIFYTLLLLGCIFPLSARQVTIFGNCGKLRFDKFPLQVNKFLLLPGKKLSNPETLKICESIENSKLVFFPYHPEPFAAQALFGDPAISRSLAEFLKKGGLLFIGHASWDTLAKRPAAMGKFFHDLKIKLPNTQNYCNTAPGGKGEKAVDGTIVPAYKSSFFNKAVPDDTFTSIRHFGSLNNTTFSPLVQSRDGKNLIVIQEKAAGQGTVLVSYAYSLILRPESAFLENILNHLYGPLKKISRRAQLRKERSAAPASSVVDLSKPREVALLLSKDGKTPRNKTTVRISGNKEKLRLEFTCYASTPSTAVRTRRDSDVWYDDCVEIFIADSQRRDATVYHVVINSLNTVYDSRNSSKLWDCKNLKSSVKKLKNGFCVTAEIPLKELNISGIFRLNLGREQVSDKEISSWQKAPAGFAQLQSAAPVTFDPALLKQNSASVPEKLQIVQVPLFTRIYPDSEVPLASRELKEIKLLLPRNDLELTQIVFFNPTEENYVFRIEPDENSPQADMFSFRELFNWRASTGETFAEIETPLNHGNLITVSGGENKVLLLGAKTDKAPGKYKWSFQIVPVNVNMPSRTVKVSVQVLPLELKEKDLPPASGFGPYFFSWSKDEKYKHIYWKQLQQYHISVVSAPVPQNTIRIEKGKIVLSEDLREYVKEEKFLSSNVRLWCYDFGVVTLFRRKLKAAGIKKDFRDPEILALFEKWVSLWAKALKKENVDFNRFTVLLQDEPPPQDIPSVVAAAKILKKYNMPLHLTFTTWTTLENMRTFSPYLDVVYPWETLVYSRENASEIKKIFKNCKLLIPYLCSRSGDFEPLQNYFRFRGIRTFLLGGSGFAMWALNSWRGNDYRSSENRPNHGSFLIHHGDSRGFVPTFRLEAYREGIEDLYYLQLAAKSNDPAVKALIAPQKLKELMSQGTPAATAVWHTALLKALAAQQSQ